MMYCLLNMEITRTYACYSISTMPENIGVYNDFDFSLKQ